MSYVLSSRAKRHQNCKTSKKRATIINCIGAIFLPDSFVSQFKTAEQQLSILILRVLCHVFLGVLMTKIDKGCLLFSESVATELQFACCVPIPECVFVYLCLWLHLGDELCRGMETHAEYCQGIYTYP